MACRTIFIRVYEPWQRHPLVTRAAVIRERGAAGRQAAPSITVSEMKRHLQELKNEAAALTPVFVGKRSRHFAASTPVAGLTDPQDERQVCM